MSKNYYKIYQEKGYVLIENLLPSSIVKDLCKITDEVIEKGTKSKKSNEFYELIPNNKTGKTNLERIRSPHKLNKFYNNLIRHKKITNVLNQLLGPNVRLQNSKINLKPKNVGLPVYWHQDWAFYPHTNDDVLAVGIMIDEMSEENGPLIVAPGTQLGPVYDHNLNGVFSGAIKKEISKNINNIQIITGIPGSVIFLHARLLHGSKTNLSEKSRRFLVYEAMAADAWPLAGCSSRFENWESMEKRMITGKQTNVPRIKDVPIRMPQPQPKHNTSIFKIQNLKSK